jgi:hypothetical protein
MVIYNTQVILSIYSYSCSCYFNSIVRKVRFTLGVVTWVVGGKQCNQWVWVSSFISSKLPWAKIFDTVSLLSLCLKANSFGTKAYWSNVDFFFKSFSPSLCQDIPSLPLWYKLNLSRGVGFAVFFNRVLILVTPGQIKACLVVLE